MQTKILFSIALLVIGIGASSQQSYYNAVTNKAGLPEKATSFNLSVVPDKETPSFVLYVSNPERKRISLQISHQQNGVAADTSFNSKSYSSRYNFEQADDGRYIVTLISGKEKISRKVEINTITTRNMIIE
ncbi:MAG TPA: hypothetical protein VI461_13955 [Chitinophagaceae bacterium]|nr:hypothetical protein [Chitinophagaceae bacterium]